MLENIREQMLENNIDWFIVFSADCHLSEYTSEADRYIAAISGFTGSAGTLVISDQEAFLWTDSRYYIQAAKQLEGTGIKLMKQGMPKVPAVEAYLAEHVWDGQRIAFDLKTISYDCYRKLNRKLPKSAQIIDGASVLKKSVTDMPQRRFDTIVSVPADRAGKSRAAKIDELRARIKKDHPEDESYTYVLSDLTSIMWLFNLRGSDIAYVPVAFSYALIDRYCSKLYVNRKMLSEAAAKELEDDGIIVREYSCFYGDLSDIATDVLLADPYGNNAAIMEEADLAGTLVECSDPTLIPKAYKNSTETEGAKTAHLKDSVTMIRFIRKVKEMAAAGDLPDEYELGKMLDDMRCKGGAEGPSFQTICAYGENSAIVHYTAQKETAAKLKPSGFLLVDSGGHYRFEGTTDITRTISLGPLTDEERKVYTTVLKGNLRLLDTVFASGFKGALLDGIAEGPLWSEGYYCGHGIGHGVGSYLSVHESEIRISRNSGEREVAFLPGAIVSDEPGVYLEGRFGVRIENLLLTVSAAKTDGHAMCRFEPLTLVPFDREAIDESVMDDNDRAVLQKYNKLIVDTVAPILNEDERAWLEEYIQ